MNVYRLSDKFEMLRHRFNRHSAICIYDNKRLTAESCRGVTAIDDNVIELILPKSRVKIVGLNMKMKSFAYDNIEIKGKLHSISFEEAEDEE